MEEMESALSPALSSSSRRCKGLVGSKPLLHGMNLNTSLWVISLIVALGPNALARSGLVVI